MANYLAEIMSAKTAIIECNTSKGFEMMADLNLEDNMERSYTIGKVDYYYETDINLFFATYANNYEYIIIDFGNSLKEFKTNISKLKHKIILGSVMPYKCVYHMNMIKCMEEFLLPLEVLHILSGDEKNVKEYAEKNRINAFPMPAIANPYIIDSKLANFFQVLF